MQGQSFTSCGVMRTQAVTGQRCNLGNGEGKKVVRENEYLSYPRFELTSDFYREVLGKAQGTAGNSSRQ